MSYRRTCLTVKHHEVRNVLHDDMSCVVLVQCNHFFPDILWVIPNIWICAEAATNLAAVSLGNLFFLQQHFVCSKTCFLRIYCLHCSCVSSWLTPFFLLFFSQQGVLY